ncbi:TIGR03089 family protein [Georgenia sp. MJ170]|uniref:TIGR03089 family protein n=1 Tax=Georgenia sunbinii TaxID=3117728 RepID=UPI002F267303
MSIATRVLELLLGEEPAQPRLTWYGADDERVELSGRVLANWVTKATNLLAEEGEVEPGTRVLLDVPVHWRGLVWALATWAAGGHLVVPGETDDDTDDDEAYEPDDDEDDDAPEASEDDESEFVADSGEDEPDVVVTSRTTTVPAAGLQLVIALPALAMRVTQPIPAGAMDAAAALMGYGDDLGYVEEPDDDDVALTGPDLDGPGPGGAVSYGELVAWAARQTPASHRDEPGARVLCSPGSLAEMIAHGVAAWRTGGSLVLLGDDVPRARFDEIAAAERATVRC